MTFFPSFLTFLDFFGNLYLFHWVGRWFRPSSAVRWVLGVILFALVISYPAGRILGLYDFNSFNQAVSFLGRSWLGFTFYWGFAAVLTDLLWVAMRFFFRRPIAPFHSRIMGGAFMAAAFLMGGYMIWEARQLEVNSLEIPLRKLPAAMDGFSIVHLSDVHFGMIHGNGRLQEMVERVNALGPDMVAITGDLVDEAVVHLEEMAEPLSKIQSRWGVFAVMGNHEAYAGVERVESILKRAGIRVLRNEIAVLPGDLQILGIDDPAVSRIKREPPPDFEHLLKQLSPEAPSILLSHRPRGFERASENRVGLQLSGHTHGPQMRLMDLGVKYYYRYTRGLFQLKESYLCVSRGVGTGGPPMRHGSRPEIVVLRLRAPSALSKGNPQ